MIECAQCSFPLDSTQLVDLLAEEALEDAELAGYMFKQSAKARHRHANHDKSAKRLMLCSWCRRRRLKGPTALTLHQRRYCPDNPEGSHPVAQRRRALRTIPGVAATADLERWLVREVFA